MCLTSRHRADRMNTERGVSPPIWATLSHKLRTNAYSTLAQTMNWKTTGRIIGVILATYVGAYFLLMRTNAPAIGTDGRPIFSSGFIFAPPQRLQGDLSVFGPRVSWANYAFFPIDQLWRGVRGLMPSRWDDEEVMKGR